MLMIELLLIVVDSEKEYEPCSAIRRESRQRRRLSSELLQLEIKAPQHRCLHCTCLSVAVPRGWAGDVYAPSHLAAYPPSPRG